jgi:ribosomal peptide maturation radical SAM protein 1
MNSLPVPDFDDYFAAIARTDLVNKANLVAEASRGCWWGAKAHCTFCGLNGTTMAYRSKAAPRLIAELVGLAERYGRSNFLMADNILDLNYLKTVFPELIAQGRMLQMFFETKSNLRKDQLELLAAAGVIDIQPGIESLSTPILQGMKKGTTRLQNVQLLKWSEEFGVTVKWNFLHGFFGEEPVEYAAMAVVIPSLRHLPPPSGCARVRLDRFSPYWKSSALHGISRMRHFWSYDFAYVGLPAVERERLAYFFESDRAGTSSEEDYTTACIDAVNDWQAAYARGATLELSICDGDWFVVDTRESPVVTRTRIAEHEVRLLRVLDRHRNRAMVVGKDTDLARALATMIDRRWVVQDGEEYLSVVLDRSERSRLVERRVSIQMQSMGLSTVTEQRDHIDKHSSSSEVTYVSG